MKLLVKILKNSLVILLLLFVQACNKEVEPEIIIERGTVADIDGNIYKTVKIGGQWWMAENLKVKHYSNGDDVFTIPITEYDSVWSDCLIGAYCSIIDTLYGSLYNHAAIKDARKLAPEGWHIPSDAEWKTLEKTIGMQQNQVDALAWRGTNEAEKLMNKSLVGWPQASIAYGSDLYGFAAIAGGCRLQNGYTNQEKNTAFFWSSSKEGNSAWYRYLDAQKKSIFRQKIHKSYGMSIRCVKD